MTESNELFREDDLLLSAYLDGELDEAQRRQVEERLEREPEAQELLSQLRSVSQSVGSLPRHDLGSDLREAVLTRGIVERREELPEESTYRRWVYAAAAIAAALLLMIYQPPQDAGDQQMAGMVRTTKPASDPQMHALASDQHAAFGSIGSLWGSQKQISLGEILKQSLERVVTQPSGSEPLGDPLSSTPVEDFHVHLRSSDDSSGLGEFEKLLSQVGIVLLDRLSGSTPAESSKLEIILLEAPLLAVQQIVVGCSQHEGVWDSAQILRPNNSAPSIFFLTFPKGDAGGIGGAARLAWAVSLDNGSATPRGWARHLNRDRLQSELVDGFGTSQIAQGQDTIRVLFFLHPAAE